MRGATTSLIRDLRTGQRRGVVVAGVLAAVSAASDLLVPLAVAGSLGMMLEGQSLGAVIWIPVGAVLVSAALAAARVSVLARLAARQMQALRVGIADKLLSLLPRSVEHLGVDEGVHVLQQGDQLEALLSAERIRRAVTAATAIGCLVLMVVFEWRLAAALLVALAACAVLVSIALKPVKRRAASGLAALADVAGEVGEFLRSVRSATVYGLRRHYLQRVGADLARVAASERAIGNAQAAVDFSVKTTLTLALLGLGGFGVALLASDETTAARLTGFLVSLGVLLAPATQYAEMLQHRSRAQAAVERIDSVGLGPDIPDAISPSATDSAVPVPTVRLELTATVIEPAPGIIVGPVSLSSAPGHLICLSGASGTGKTTLLAAIAGFLPLEAGSATLNNTDLRSWKSEELWRNIAFVEQTTPIIGRTVRDFLDPEGVLEDGSECLRALHRLGLSERLSAAGLDTPLERMGTALSGGERQRLSLARAFCSDRPLLLLDEPTSHLDRASEEQVAEMLGELRSSKSIVVATHSARLIDLADEVLTLTSTQEEQEVDMVAVPRA